MANRRKVDINPFNSIASILILVFIFFALYWVASSVFWLLTKLSPILLIGALIIDYNVVLNYGKWMWKLLKKNPVMGIGAVLLTIFGYPIIFGFLFGKALLYRKVNKMKKEHDVRTNGEFVEYEEIKEEPKIKLELPSFEKPKQEKGGDYEQFFD